MGSEAGSVLCHLHGVESRGTKQEASTLLSGRTRWFPCRCDRGVPRASCASWMDDRSHRVLACVVLVVGSHKVFFEASIRVTRVPICLGGSFWNDS